MKVIDGTWSYLKSEVPAYGYLVLSVIQVSNSLVSILQGSPYYDNVRPLCYSDSDAVLLCFDISRPDTVDSSLKKVMASVLTFTVIILFSNPLSHTQYQQFLQI